MADVTVNISVDENWTKVAEDSATNVIITNRSPWQIEYGYTDADSAPSASLLQGHVLEPGEVMSRLADGYIWARTFDSADSTASLAVTAT